MIRPPVISTDSSGMTTTGMTPRMPLGTFHRLIQRAAKPPMKPVAMPPRKPAPMVAAMKPSTMPGARPGRSAIANAMNPDRIGTRKLNEAAPTRNKSAAQCIPSPGLKSVTMLTMCVGFKVGARSGSTAS
jgi:hypothetical protein